MAGATRRPAESYDWILMGTGSAVLLAARMLVERGEKVLVLNPERDFFLEPCEFEFRMNVLDESSAPTSPSSSADEEGELVLKGIGPFFPGAVEEWSADRGPTSAGFVDSGAPFVRTRNCTWVSEEPFLRKATVTSEGMVALSKIPGIEVPLSQMKERRVFGAAFSKFIDLDLQRYREGLLEFLRDREDQIDLCTEIKGVEPLKGSQSVRFYFEGRLLNSHARSGVIYFWTPGLATWVGQLEKQYSWKLPKPTGLQSWECWTLLSKRKLPMDSVAVIGETVLMPQIEGGPTLESSVHSLRAFRRGGEEVSSRSIENLHRLFDHWLGWNYFTIRALDLRMVLTWEGGTVPAPLRPGDGFIWVCPGSDGSLSSIARNVSSMIEGLS